MKRRLSSIIIRSLTVLLLLPLFVVTCVLWVRSRTIYKRLSYCSYQGREVRWGTSSWNRTLSLWRVKDTATAGIEPTFECVRLHAAHDDDPYEILGAPAQFRHFGVAVIGLHDKTYSLHEIV